MSKKFALVPGYIISGYDKQRHYISAFKLALLYKVKLYECVIFRDGIPYDGYNIDDYILLRVRQDGQYKQFWKEENTQP